MGESSTSFKAILVQATPFLLLSGLGELLAGWVLQNYLLLIRFAPGLLVLLPALMDLRGAIQSTLAARLGSAYHLGLIKQRSSLKNVTIRQNLAASFGLTMIVSVAAGVFAYLACEFFGLARMPLHSFVIISLTASMLVMLLLSATTLALTFYSIKRKMDPDNVTIPALTTIGDLMMVIAIYLVVALVVGGQI